MVEVAVYDALRKMVTVMMVKMRTLEKALMVLMKMRTIKRMMKMKSDS